MTVFGDIENKTLIDICESRVHKTLGAFFDEEMPNPQAIQIICHDMSKGYRKFSLRYLPQRDIVVDKFHVIMKANQAIDRARIAISIDKATSKETKRALRKERRIYLAKNSELAESTRSTRDERLAKYPELKAAYRAKEKFYSFYKCRTKEEAASFYNKWLRGLSKEQRVYFEPLISCMSSPIWRPHIFNYFDHPNVTTGYLERLNRAINETSRAGKGYSFEILRRKLVLAHGERPVPPPKFDREGKEKAKLAALPPGEQIKKQKRSSKAKMLAARAAGEAKPKRHRERLKQGVGVRQKGILRYSAGST
jgi:transposase